MLKIGLRESIYFAGKFSIQSNSKTIEPHGKTIEPHGRELIFIIGWLDFEMLLNLPSKRYIIRSLKTKFRLNKIISSRQIIFQFFEKKHSNSVPF